MNIYDLPEWWERIKLIVALVAVVGAVGYLLWASFSR